jgi:hypothetical protein
LSYPEVAVTPHELYEHDLVYEHEAVAATGVPGKVIRQWASRGRIMRFKGDGRYSGQGHEYKTMYALPEILERAKTYRPRTRQAA